ncbi:MAG TPA: hypothetical protein DCQ50_03190 [Chryseobacterium sp.]|nr:hypothetical protein [Chryseobacterium sp.]
MIAFINYIACKFLYPFIVLSGSNIYLSWFRVAKQNTCELKNSQVTKSRITVNGEGNKIEIINCHLSNSTFSVNGKDNKIFIARGVHIKGGNITIRGNNCIVTIGAKTTFGGIRIINVGSNNSILIGEECLFSDQIEIWASDTHAIYNDDGVWVNKEKPITVGNGVWVGSRVTILKGVVIADGAIIGMGTTVTKNVAKNTLVAGNSAKIIKENIRWSLEYPLNKE